MYLNWICTTTPPALLEAECHIWLWGLDKLASVESELKYLSAGELVVAHRFLFKKDFSKYVRCHSLMRQILAAYLQCLPEAVPILALASGKPVLNRNCDDLHFSLSHTDSHGMLAIASSPVGVDVEVVRPIDSDLAAMNFSVYELEQLNSYEGEEWNRCFFRCWTRKEALLKAEGVGITVDLSSFDVEIAHDKLPSLSSHEGATIFSSDWQLGDISPSENLIAAVATTSKVKKLNLFSLPNGKEVFISQRR